MKRNLIVLASLTVAASAFAAGPARVIYSNIPSSPTNFLPGAPTATLGIGDTEPLLGLFASPSADKWILRVQVEGGTNDPDAWVIGTGTTSTGLVTAIREGDAYGPLTTSIATFRQTAGVNDDGGWISSFDTSLATTSDEIVIWKPDSASALSTLAQEGVVIPGLATNNWGNAMNSAHFGFEDLPSFRTGTTTPAFTGLASFNSPSNPIFKKTNDAIAGQLVSPSQTVRSFTAERFLSKTLFSQWLVHGNFNGATTSDLFMAYGGTVIAQEGAVLPGSGFTDVVSGFASQGADFLSRDGQRWIIRGNNVAVGGTTSAFAQDWVLSNVGGVLAFTDGPVAAGSTATWDDSTGNGLANTFFYGLSNNFGDTIIGGTTNDAAPLNDVVVLNGCQIVIREDDAVDVNGDGLGDNVFIDSFDEDDAFLRDDNFFMFVAELVDNSGAFLGEALLSIKLPLTGDVSGDDECGPGDLQAVLDNFGEPSTSFPAADLDCDGEIGPGDLQIVLDNFGRSR